MKDTSDIAKALRSAGISLEGGKVLKTVLPPELAGEAVQARNKYGATPTAYNGVRYDSKAEADYARVLDDRAAIDGSWWIRQPVFRLGCPENVYRADFLVYTPAHLEELRIRVVDVKGVRTAKFARDLKLWKSYGPCPLVVVTRKGKGWREETVRRGGR